MQRNLARLRKQGELEEKYVGAAIAGPMAVLEQRRQSVGPSWPVGLFLPAPPGKSDAIWKANKVQYSRRKVLQHVCFEAASMYIHLDSPLPFSRNSGRFGGKSRVCTRRTPCSGREMTPTFPTDFSPDHGQGGVGSTGCWWNLLTLPTGAQLCNAQLNPHAMHFSCLPLVLGTHVQPHALGCMNEASGLCYTCMEVLCNWVFHSYVWDATGISRTSMWNMATTSTSRMAAPHCQVRESNPGTIIKDCPHHPLPYPGVKRASSSALQRYHWRTTRSDLAATSCSRRWRPQYFQGRRSSLPSSWLSS